MAGLHYVRNESPSLIKPRRYNFSAIFPFARLENNRIAIQFTLTGQY